MKCRMLITAVLFLAGAAAPVAAPGQCHTYYFAGWDGYTGANLAISGGLLSLERTREIGEEWEDVSLPGAPATGIYDLVQFTDGNLYAAGENLNGPVIWRSTDGIGWAPVTLLVPGVRRAQKASRLAVSVDGSRLYAATRDTTIHWPEPGISAVWRSSDGLAWEVMTGLPDAGGCTSVVETADGKLVAATKDSGTVWCCPDPEGAPEHWIAAWTTASAAVGGVLPQPNYPAYPPPYDTPCAYLMNNYGEHCAGMPYDAYPVPFRPDRTQGLFRASDGWIYLSTSSADASRWAGGKSVRGFGHIYTSTDGLNWFDGGSFEPPPADSEEYYYTVGTFSELTHFNGTPPADNPPQHQTFPTWIDNFHQDAEGNVYAGSTNAEPVRSFILDPRRDAVIYRLEKGASPESNRWVALGNLSARPKSPCATDSYTSYNAVFGHDLASEPLTGRLWAATSMLGQVHRSDDGGASFAWWTSPRQAVNGLPATGDFTSLLITCGSCLYAGYTANGEIYASRSRFSANGWIEDTVGWGYPGPLAAFGEIPGETSYGTITYQVADGPGSFRWWDGGSWAAATGPGQSNPAAEIDAHIGDFPEPGTFYFRAYFNSQSDRGCPKTQVLGGVVVCLAAALTPSPTPSLTPTPVSPWGTPSPTAATPPAPSATPPPPTPPPAGLELVKVICEPCGPGISILPPCGPSLIEYRVTNTGSAPLGEIVITDDAGTPEDPSDDYVVGVVPGPVPAGASFSFQTLQAAGARIANTVEAVSSADSQPVSARDTALAFTRIGAAGGDYNGDGRSDPAVFACAGSSWRINLEPAAPPQITYFGNWGDQMVPGDYDGDGTAEIAVFRDHAGLWAVRGLTRAYFGKYDDLPVPADYDGDGSADIAVRRPPDGLWAVRGLTRVYFGGCADLPVPGDYDGTGTGRPAVFRPETGLWAVRGLTRIYLGGGEDLPVPHDYSGDGADDFAVFRDSAGLWLVRGLTRAYFGRRFDWPQPGDYRGDGAADIAVFRPATFLWAVRNHTRLYWGVENSVPVSR